MPSTSETAMHLCAMYRKTGDPTKEVVINAAGPSHALMKEVARRAIGLEEARRNAKASQLLAEDYADHSIVFGSANSELKVDYVTFDLSIGYHHAPYITFQSRRQGITIYGRFSLEQLKRIYAYAPMDDACCRCHDQMAESDVLKGDGICTSCVVATT